MADRAPIAKIVGSFSIINTILIHDLEELGLLHDFDIAKQLREAADADEKSGPNPLKSGRKSEPHILRRVASLIEKHRASSASRDGKPMLIEGRPRRLSARG
jgi:hypothetical protein